MATIKSFTTLEQSKVLAEILPLESADMCCFQNPNGSINYYGFPFLQGNKDSNPIPCWSLSALFSVLSYYPTLHRTISGWRCDIYNEKGYISQFGEDSDNPVDACYEMILKLKEQNLI